MTVIYIYFISESPKLKLVHDGYFQSIYVHRYFISRSIKRSRPFGYIQTLEFYIYKTDTRLQESTFENRFIIITCDLGYYFNTYLLLDLNKFFFFMPHPEGSFFNISPRVNANSIRSNFHGNFITYVFQADDVFKNRL